MLLCAGPAGCSGSRSAEKISQSPRGAGSLIKYHSLPSTGNGACSTDACWLAVRAEAAPTSIPWNGTIRSPYRRAGFPPAHHLRKSGADDQSAPAAGRVTDDEAVEQFRHGQHVFEVSDAGPADGQVVVLLHGHPQSNSAWDAVIPRLTEHGYRCLAPNQRGHSPGARPARRWDYRMSELVADVDALIDESGAERVHLVGHDWVRWWHGVSRPVVATVSGRSRRCRVRIPARCKDQC